MIKKRERGTKKKRSKVILSLCDEWHKQMRGERRISERSRFIAQYRVRIRVGSVEE